MAQGLSVEPPMLQVGSQNFTALQGYWQAAAEGAVELVNTMAGAAGLPSVISALNSFAGRGDKVFGGIVAAYGNGGKGLASALQIYTAADQAVAASAKGVPDQDVPFLNGIG